MSPSSSGLRRKKRCTLALLSTSLEFGRPPTRCRATLTFAGLYGRTLDAPAELAGALGELGLLDASLEALRAPGRAAVGAMLDEAGAARADAALFLAAAFEGGAS